MNIKNFSDAIHHIDDKYIDEALNYRKNKKITLIKFGMVAACFAVIVTAVSFLPNLQDEQQNQVISSENKPKNEFTLSDNSYNVTVNYNEKAPNMITEYSLVGYTEDELFTVFDTHIFKGKILSLDNIEIDFNGEKMYRAIAQIEIEKVYRGSCDKGDIVSVMLPCPIAEGVWVEDTDTVSAMKEGMTGIFMPIFYTEKNSFLEYNNARLVQKDIADYGFADGLRYAFLQTEDGLIFDRYSYKTISDATTLDEVEEYIQTMLEKLNK